MGSESSKSESDSSNSGEKNSELEEMNDLKENKNTIINRVWVVKKSINLTDENVELHMGTKLFHNLWIILVLLNMEIISEVY